MQTKTSKQTQLIGLEASRCFPRKHFSLMTSSRHTQRPERYRYGRHVTGRAQHSSPPAPSPTSWSPLNSFCEPASNTREKEGEVELTASPLHRFSDSFVWPGTLCCTAAIAHSSLWRLAPWKHNFKEIPACDMTAEARLGNHREVFFLVFLCVYE